MADAEKESSPRSLADVEQGEQLGGKVTKTELFGAFVDVGLDREGMIHISMLKRGHVNRVEDVVEVGDTVEVWVHRIDPASGRLELTMIEPVEMNWKDLKPQMRVKGKVVRLESFGAFVDIGAERPGLVHVSELSNDYVPDPSDVVKVGDEVEVTVLEINRKKRQIRLSMKEDIYQEEPDPEPEEEIPTAMEFALRQALEASDDTEKTAGGPPDKEVKRDEEIEEILSRTLEHRVHSSSQNK